MQPDTQTPQPAAQAEIPDYVKELIAAQQRQIDELKQIVTSAQAAPAAAPVAAPASVKVKQWRNVPTGIEGGVQAVDIREQIYEKDIFDMMNLPDPEDKHRTQFEKLGLVYEVIE